MWKIPRAVFKLIADPTVAPIGLFDNTASRLPDRAFPNWGPQYWMRALSTLFIFENQFKAQSELIFNKSKHQLYIL